LACAAVRVPPLLRTVSNDEVPPLPRSPADRRALASLPDTATVGRTGTAATLRAIDAAHGGGFYDVDEAATVDPAAADAAFASSAAVVDVQTHLVDATRWTGPHAAALEGFLRMVDPDRWSEPVDPRAIDAAAWATLVFG